MNKKRTSKKVAGNVEKGVVRSDTGDNRYEVRGSGGDVLDQRGDLTRFKERACDLEITRFAAANSRAVALSAPNTLPTITTTGLCFDMDVHQSFCRDSRIPRFLAERIADCHDDRSSCEVECEELPSHSENGSISQLRMVADSSPRCRIMRSS